MLECKDPLEKVVSFLRKTAGVRRFKILSDEERRSLLQAELTGEESMSGGRGFNEGLREALSRPFVVACSTYRSFQWPSGPYVVLKEGNVVVGFITDDINQVKEQHNEKISVIGKNLVIFPERIRRLRCGKRLPTTFVHKGFNLPELEKETKVKDTVLAFCTRAGDAYLKKLLNEEDRPELGSIVIGFAI
jgi:hypothetical protein